MILTCTRNPQKKKEFQRHVSFYSFASPSRAKNIDGNCEESLYIIFLIKKYPINYKIFSKAGSNLSLKK